MKIFTFKENYNMRLTMVIQKSRAVHRLVCMRYLVFGQEIERVCGFFFLFFFAVYSS